MLSNNFIEPLSPKYRALRTYANGTHSHNHTFNTADWSGFSHDEMSMLELRDIARDQRNEIMRSNLAQAGLITVELSEEDRTKIHLNVWLTEMGETAYNRVTSGFVWDCAEEGIDLAMTAKFYELALAADYISDRMFDLTSTLTDPFFSPYVKQFMRRRLALA